MAFFSFSLLKDSFVYLSTKIEANKKYYSKDITLSKELNNKNKTTSFAKINYERRVNINNVGKTLLIFSTVVTSLQPSTAFPLLLTPITLAPNDLTCFAIDDPKEPVPTTTTVLPAIGLLKRDTNSLFFWFVTILVI